MTQPVPEQGPEPITDGISPSPFEERPRALEYALKAFATRWGLESPEVTAEDYSVTVVHTVDDEQGFLVFPAEDAQPPTEQPAAVDESPQPPTPPVPRRVPIWKLLQEFRHPYHPQ